MSVKDGLLALLGAEPMGVAQLRREFETRTGGTWPLNIGQVYTTVQRLERDGLIEPYVAGDDADHATGQEAIERFTLTAAGRDVATNWWSTPVDRGKPERDELVIKLALAATMPNVDVPTVVQRQRVESMKALRDYTRLKAQADERDDLAWLLVLDNLIFATEAEVRWLDHIETTVARAQLDGDRAEAAAIGRTCAPTSTAPGTGTVAPANTTAPTTPAPKEVSR